MIEKEIHLHYFSENANSIFCIILNSEKINYEFLQVLEAIQYLHFRGICYLELQPDNVVMVNLRDSDIKLVDFGSARFVPKTGAKVQVEGTIEYLGKKMTFKQFSPILIYKKICKNK